MIALAAALGLAGAALLAAMTPFYAYFACALLIAVAMGLVQYYARVDAALWIAPGVTTLLFVRSWIEQRAAPARRAARLPAYVAALLLFFGVGLVTTLASHPDAAQLVVAIKNYGLVWLVVPVAARLVTRRGFLTRIETGLLWLLIAQLPVVLVQAATVANWDGVVGTFGGDPEAGGASGTLMFYAVVALLMAASLWQQGRLPLPLLLGFVGIGFLLVSFAEVKAFFFLLPLGLLIQQRRRVLTSPLQAAVIFGVVIVASRLVLQLYAQNYSGSSGRADTIGESLAYFFDPDFVSTKTGEVSRGASIALWVRYAGPDLLHRAIGYGAGASRSASTVSVGALAERFGAISLNATAASQLLWDLGIVGLTLFVGVFGLAIRAALRLSRRTASPVVRARADTIVAILTIAVPMLIYDRSLVDGPAIQFLCATAIGVLAGLDRGQASRNATAPTRPSPPRHGPSSAVRAG